MMTTFESNNTFADLLQKSFEQVLEASRNSLDMAVKYNNEILGATRKSLNLSPSTPGLSLFDVAGKAFENYAELQKNILGIVGEHGNAVVGAVREGGKVSADIAASTQAKFHESVDRTAAAHKAVLDFAAKQNKQVVAALKQQEGIAGTPLVETADAVERGMEALIEAQKHSVEVAANQLKSATKA